MRRIKSIVALAAISVMASTLVLASDSPPASAAPPLPTATLDVPTGSDAPLLGEDLEFGVIFDNADGDATGYGPIVDLFVDSTGADGDDGATFVAAEYLGTPVAAQALTIPTCPSFTHPVTGEPVACPAGFASGDQLVVLTLPFGSYTPDQPEARLDVTLAVSPLADAGVPLGLAARGQFRYGADPLDNPADDPAIVGAITAASHDPQVVRVDKEYVGPEDETATGPNYVRAYRMEIDVADGQTVTDLVIGDVLPDTLVYAGGLTAPPTAAVELEPAVGVDPPPAAAGDRTVRVRVPSVTGTAGAVDAVVEFDVYVARVDAADDPVLDPVGGDDRPIENTVSADADWDPIDPRDAAGALPTASDSDSFVAKSIAIQKSSSLVTDVGVAGMSPGDTVEWVAEVQISDYFTGTDLMLADVMDDGLVWDAGFTPTISSTEAGLVTGPTAMDPGDVVVVEDACPAGTTSVAFDVSSALDDPALVGGRVDDTTGPATVTIRYRTTIATTFRCPPGSGNDRVSGGDGLDNDVDVTTAFLDPAGVPTGGAEADASGSGVEIPRGDLTKAVYARNGSTTGPFDEFAAGDTITYRLTQELPVGNVEALRIDDYLPLPVLDVTGFSTTFDTTISAAAPAAGQAKYGPAHTFVAPDFPGAPTPVLSTDDTSNLLRFDFGDYESGDGQDTAVIDLLLTVEISDDPFADGLFLTNIARTTQSNSFSDATIGDDIVQFELTEPVLDITKGVVATDQAGAAFSPPTVGPVAFAAPGTSPSFTPTITSAGLASSPVDSTLAGVDADDLVTFAIVVENTGSGLNGAFDVLVIDSLPDGLSVPAGGLNLQVRDGGGNPLPYSAVGGGLFDSSGGIVLADGGEGALAALDDTSALDGSNIAVITYDLVLDGDVEPGDTFTNTAELAGYSATEGGPNFVGTLTTDTAAVSVPLPAVDKSITGTSAAHTGGNDVVIGEHVSYEVEVTIPEGAIPEFTITDTLGCGLALVSLDGLVASPGLTTTASGSFAGALGDAAVSDPTCTGGGGSGRRVVVDLGTLTNADTDDAQAETITLTYTVAVLNTSANVADQTLSNDVVTSAGGGDSAPDVTVRVPNPTLDKSFDVTTADSNDQVTITLAVANAGGHDVFDAVLTDPVPAGLTVVDGTFACTGTAVPTTTDDSGPSVGATWSTLADGTSASCTFDAIVDDDAVELGTLENEASLAWSSLPGVDNTSPSPYTTLDVERTGTPSDPGQINDNRTTASDDLVLDTASIAKSLVGTSFAGTAGSSVTVGEVVNYELDITVAEGTYASDVVVVDQLPPGLAYVDGSASVDTTGFAGALGASSVAADGGSGDDLTITFAGPNVVTDDNDPTNNTFTVALQAIVVDVPAAVAGASLGNTGSVTTGTTALSNVVTVDVVEPDLSIDKDVSGQIGDTDTRGVDVDDTLEFSVTVANGAVDVTAAHDVVVVDVVPAGLVVDAGSISGGGVWDSGTRTITWSVPGPVAPSATETFTYSVDVGPGSSFSAATTFTNTAVIDEYFAFPEADRSDPSNSDVDYRAYGGASDTVVVDPDAPDLSVEKSSTGPATIGAPFTWTVTVTNEADVATAFGIDVVDTLPLDWSYVSGSAQLGGNPTADPAIDGQELTWTDLGDLAPGASVTLTFEALTGWDARDNATHTNSVDATALDADGFDGNLDGSYTDSDTDTPALTGASLGDRVWEDLNGNGRQDAGEPGIAGVAVDLAWAGPDGTFGTADDASLSTTTDGTGAYDFALLMPGDHVVTFTTPAGFEVAYSNSPVATDATDSDIDDEGESPVVSLTAGQSDTTVDAGYIELADLGDLVWEDRDGDGVQGAGEPGVEGVLVTLDWAGPDGAFGTADDVLAVATDTTDADGLYLFPDLSPGTYRIGVTPPADHVFTASAQGSDDAIDSNVDGAGIAVVAVVSGEDDTSIDAGLFVGAAIGDTVWYDLDGDGVQDAGEPGAAGVTVDLLDGGGTVVDSTTTGPGGTFTFTDLTPATYALRFTAPAGTAFTSTGAGTAATDSDADPTTGETPATSLASAETDLSWDAGLVGTGSIGDLIWEDLDGDGTDDAGEPGIADATVTLTWAGPDGSFGTADDAVIGSTTTGTDGLYSFGGLLPGGYRVAVTGTDGGLVPTEDLDGTASAGVATLTLAPGADRTDVDFGYQLQADLSILKTVDDPTVDAGDLVTFTLEVGNTGPADAAGPIVVEDTLPDGLTFDEATGTGWSCSDVAQVITCTRPGPITPGEGVPAITLTAMVDADADASLTNVATVDGATVDPDLSDNSDDAEVTTTLVADLTITKSHTVDFTVGQTGTYTLLVGNQGPSASVGTVDDPITVTDTVPEGLTPLTASGTGWTCSIDEQDVTCEHVGTVASGASPAPIALTVDVGTTADLAADGGTVVNSATVIAGVTVDRDSTNDTDDDPTTVVPVADLRLVKTSGGSFVVDGQGTFTFTVTNAGPSTAAGTVTLTDTLVAGLTYAGSTSTDGWTCAAAGQDVTCTLATGMVVDEVTEVAITVDVDATVDPTVTNSATVTSPTLDPELTNNTSGTTDPSTPTVDLVVDKHHAANFQVGTQGTFVIDVGNAGPSTSDGEVTVTDTVPAGLTPVSVSGDAADPTDPSWLCSITGQELECAIDDVVPAGGSFPPITLVVDVLPAAYPSVTNTATVTAPPDVNEFHTEDNADDDLVDVLPLVDLALTKSHIGDFVVGATGTYVLTVTNEGPNEDPGPITIVDDLPVGLTYVSGTGDNWACATAGQTVECTYDGAPLAVGADTTVTLVVEIGVAAEGGVVNTAIASTASVDDDSSNDTAEDPTGIVPAVDLSVAKTHRGDVVVGSAVEWTLVVENAGPSASTGPIVVTDDVPDGFEVESATGDGWSCTILDQLVTCTRVDALAVGPAPAVTLRAVPQVGIEGEVTNVATVDGPELDPNPTNDTDGDVVEVLGNVDLVLNKTLVGGDLVAGRDGVWQLEVRNNGPSAATDVVVTDRLPEGLGFTAAAGDGWSCTAEGQTVVCELDGDLVGGASTTLELTTSVDASIVGRSLINTAEVASAGVDAVPADNGDASAPTTVAPALTGDLPRTGSDVGRMVRLGAGSLLIGAALWLIARRRRGAVG